jgi:hypothetical protein
MNLSALTEFQETENSISSPSELDFAPRAVEDQLPLTPQIVAVKSNAITNVAAIFMPPGIPSSI